MLKAIQVLEKMLEIIPEDLGLMKDSNKSKSTLHEAELAQLALEIYGKKSSVLYDLASITDLIQQ